MYPVAVDYTNGFHGFGSIATTHNFSTEPEQQHNIAKAPQRQTLVFQVVNIDGKQ